MPRIRLDEKRLTPHESHNVLFRGSRLLYLSHHVTSPPLAPAVVCCSGNESSFLLSRDLGTNVIMSCRSLHVVGQEGPTVEARAFVPLDNPLVPTATTAHRFRRLLSQMYTFAVSTNGRLSLFATVTSVFLLSDAANPSFGQHAVLASATQSMTPWR